MAIEGSNPLKVLLFPWLAYGHLQPFWELAKKLADRGLSVYFCTTQINLESIRSKTNSKYSSLINLVELRLAELPELPPHYHTTNGLPPHLLSTLKNAIHMSKPELSVILEAIRPDVIIYDMNLSWFAALTSKHNIPAIRFMISSATLLAYFCHMTLKPGVPFPFPGINLTDFEQSRAQTTLEIESKDMAGDDPGDELPNRFCDKFTLVKTSWEFEGKFLDYISNLLDWNTFPICAFLYQEPESARADDHDLIHFLDTKNEHSTVFVSCGSEYFFNKEEISEIASALELSDVNFIWVLRFPKGETEKTNVEEILPDGFLQRVKEKGRIVEGWAPQRQILGHSSIGGFVCHCGLNSVMESIQMGVPIIAMPMHLDQPLTAKTVVEMGVAVEVTRNENGVLKKEGIAEAIKSVIFGENGKNMKGKMKDLADKIKGREEEELDRVLEILAQFKIEGTCNGH